MARPTHKPTPAQRRKVSLAAGGGVRHEVIALGLGISLPTLSKHYELELSSGAASRRLEVVASLYAAARKGSSSAAKAYLQIESQVAAPPLPKEKPQGKKAQANADAKTAEVGTDWSDLLGKNVTPIRKPAA